MVTIKDIARAAGVAQGTVSNVLNGKGNVSSDKIAKVLEKAEELGYIPNERAKALRKGSTKLLGVILPNMRFSHYVDFFLSFKFQAEEKGYSVVLQLSNDDNPDAEIVALQEIRTLMPAGIATISCLSNIVKENPYTPLQVHHEHKENILFVDRTPSFPAHYIGFDFEDAGRNLAKRAIRDGHQKICLLTGNQNLSNEGDFLRGFIQTASHDCQIHHVQTDVYRKLQNIIQIFNDFTPEAIVISNYGFAETVKDIVATFLPNERFPIYTVSNLFTLPEQDFVKYEFNYCQLGQIAAQKLIEFSSQKTTKPMRKVLPSAGFRDWFKYILPITKKKPLQVLTLESPSAYATSNLSKLYTKKTGTPVEFTICPYQEIYRVFSDINPTSKFDIIRLDVTWLSWFAEQIFAPMEEIDPSIRNDLHSFIDGTVERYSRFRGKIYALPSTPSTQVLFYRRDLFESPIYKRMFWEMNGSPLDPPETFERFNQIARFFTKSINPVSPVDYGATVTLGSAGVASSEFLARLFSYQEHLYDTDGKIRLNAPNSFRALQELVEVKQYSSVEYCQWWTNTAKSFAAGNVAMAITYSNFASSILSHSSKVVGNIGFAMMPGRNPLIGGGSLGVARYSQRKEESLSFIRWLCSEPVSAAGTMIGSVSSCKQAYENMEIIRNFPWLNLAKASFSTARGRRTPNDHDRFDEKRFIEIIGNAVKNVYHQRMTAETALTEAQQLFLAQFGE